MELIEYKPLHRIYEIYVNKYQIDTPCNFHTTVKVLNETDDTLIDNWCYKVLGPLYRTRGKELFKAWQYMKVDDITESELNTIIKRK